MALTCAKVCPFSLILVYLNAEFQLFTVESVCVLLKRTPALGFMKNVLYRVGNYGEVYNRHVESFISRAGSQVGACVCLVESHYVSASNCLYSPLKFKCVCSREHTPQNGLWTEPFGLLYSEVWAGFVRPPIGQNGPPLYNDPWYGAAPPTFGGSTISLCLAVLLSCAVSLL